MAQGDAVSGPSWDGFDLGAEAAIAAACAIPAGEGPRGFRLEREGPEPSGGAPARLVLEAWAMTEPELLVEVARAVAAVVTGAGSGGGAADDEERSVALDAEDTASRLLAWIDQLLAWARRDGFVTDDGTLRLADPGRLTGVARGGRWAQLPAVSLEPTEDDLFVAATCSRWIARVELAPRSPSRAGRPQANRS